MDNKLSLHLGKTESILFGSKRKFKKVESFDVKCGDIAIKRVTSVKYLGLKIDIDPGSNSIVKGTISKVNCRVTFFI